MRRSALAVVAVLAVVVGGCAQPSGQPSAEIAALSEEWIDVLNEGDIDTLVGLYTEDCRLMAPNEETMQGHEAVAATFGGMVKAGLGGRVETVEIIAAGTRCSPSTERPRCASCRAPRIPT